MRRSGVGERCTAGKAIRRYHELFCISDVSGRGDSVASLSAVGFTALIMHKASSTLFLDSGRYVPDSARTTPQCLDDPAADFHSTPKATLARSLHYSTPQLHPLSRRTLLHAKHHVKSRRHDKLAFFADFSLRNVWSDCPGCSFLIRRITLQWRAQLSSFLSIASSQRPRSCRSSCTVTPFDLTMLPTLRCQCFSQRCQVPFRKVQG